MGLIFGIIGIVITICLMFLIVFANGMSDAPSEDGFSVSPVMIIGFGISGILIFTHFVHIPW